MLERKRISVALPVFDPGLAIKKHCQDVEKRERSRYVKGSVTVPEGKGRVKPLLFWLF